MSEEHYDVIVIGAGLGGLSAAGYLAKAGKKVLLLEHHSVPGGYAHEFRRGKFRFEVALHAMDGVREGGWVYPILSELGVMDQVTFHELSPFYTVRFPNHEITVHNDKNLYTSELIHQFPEEETGILSLFDALERTESDVRKYSAARSRGEQIPMMEMPGKFPDMVMAMTQTWGDYLALHVSDEELIGVLSTLWGYFGLPPSQLSAGGFALAFTSYLLYGAYYPEGGSFAISRAIEKTILDYGGEVKFNQTVNRIEMKDGLAYAVETEKGLRATADLFISNASAPMTIEKMIGRKYFADDYLTKIDKEKPAVSNLVVYLGLNRDIAAEGHTAHELFLSNTYNVEESYQNMMEGNWEKVDTVITNYGPVCERACPEGYSAVMIMCLASMDYEDQWGTHGDFTNYRDNPRYLELKERAGEALIDRVAEVIPNLRESIIEKEIATPVTNVRYSLNPGGSIYGSEQTVDNMFMNRLSAKSPIENLIFSGAWVNGGGMSTALMSGKTAAGLGGAFFGKRSS